MQKFVVERRIFAEILIIWLNTFINQWLKFTEIT